MSRVKKENQDFEIAIVEGLNLKACRVAGEVEGAASYNGCNEGKLLIEGYGKGWHE